MTPRSRTAAAAFLTRLMSGNPAPARLGRGEGTATAVIRWRTRRTSPTMRRTRAWLCARRRRSGWRLPHLVLPRDPAPHRPEPPVPVRLWALSGLGQRFLSAPDSTEGMAVLAPINDPPQRRVIRPTACREPPRRSADRTASTDTEVRPARGSASAGTPRTVTKTLGNWGPPAQEASGALQHHGQEHRVRQHGKEIRDAVDRAAGFSHVVTSLGWDGSIAKQHIPADFRQESARRTGPWCPPAPPGASSPARRDPGPRRHRPCDEGTADEHAVRAQGQSLKYPCRCAGRRPPGWSACRPPRRRWRA